MGDLIDFLVHARVVEIAFQPWVMVAAAGLFLLSVILRWRIVALTIFAAAALIAVAGRAKVLEGKAVMDQNMLVFAVGSLLVIVVVIYFLFIRGD